MPKSHLIQTNFTAGELSPLMVGRVDTQKYQNGADQLLNFLVRQQGAIWRRPGTSFISEVKDSSKLVIVQEWTFSDSQEYVLEIGEHYIRIWLNGGFVETSIGSGVPLELVTPYLQGDLNSLRFSQSADVMYISSGKYPLMQLQRLAANTWQILPFFTNDGPYLAVNDLINISLTLADVSAQADATASSPLFTASTGIAITGTSSGSNGTTWGAIPQLRVLAVGNTFTVGQQVQVAGLKVTYTNPANGLVYVTAGANFPLGNGIYVVAANSGGNVTLANSISALNTAGYAYDFSNATISGVNDLGYVEYRENNLWRLGRILQAKDTTHATIAPLLVYKDDIESEVKISYDATNLNITSDHAGVFSSADQGKYYRLQNGSWVLLSGFINDSQFKVATGILSVRYVYPGIVVTVQNQSTVGVIFSGKAIFSATDVGRCIRLNINGNQPWGRILYFINAFEVVVVIPDNIVGLDPITGLVGGATNLLKLGAWSDTTSWPKVIAFHEQRMVLANSDTEPQNLWMSQSADFPNFAPTLFNSTVTDACAITYTLASTRANPILWMISGPTLLLGTLGSEYQVKATTLGSPLTPTNIQVLLQTAHGSLSTAIPYRIGYATLFVQRAGRKLFELYYEFTLDSYVSRNLTITSEHMLRNGDHAIRVSFQKEPNAIVWVLLADGTLAAMTYERDQQITAWHRHIPGGSVPNQIPGGAQYNATTGIPYTYTVTGLIPGKVYNLALGAHDAALEINGPGFLQKNLTTNGQFSITAGQTVLLLNTTDTSGSGPFAPISVTAVITDTDPSATQGVFVESICVVASQPGTEDVLYMIVRRTINGVTRRYIEAMQPDFFPTSPTDRTGMWYLDCAQQYDGAPASHITGLDYLEGETMTVVADGALLSQKLKVVGGAIDLPAAASVVTVGYPYRSLYRNLPLEGGNPTGQTSQGIIKRPSKIIFRLLSSLGFSIGIDLTKMQDVSFREIPDNAMNQSPPLFTGDWPINVPSEYTKTGQLYVVTDEPYPLNILAVITDSGVYGS